MVREDIFSDPKFEKITELPGATAPGPHQLAKILDRGIKADRCLQWLEKASSRTSNLKKLLSFQSLPPLDPITLLRYLREI